MQDEDNRRLRIHPIWAYVHKARTIGGYAPVACAFKSVFFFLSSQAQLELEGLFGVFLVPSHSDHHDVHINGLLESSLSVLHFLHLALLAPLPVQLKVGMPPITLA